MIEHPMHGWSSRTYRKFFGHISVFERPTYNPTGHRWRIHVYPKGSRKFPCTDVWRPIEASADTIHELFAQVRAQLK